MGLPYRIHSLTLAATWDGCDRIASANTPNSRVYVELSPVSAYASIPTHEHTRFRSP